MKPKKGSPIQENLTLQVILGEDSKLPYIAVEFFQLSQFSSGFTLSCFPLDYQGVVNARMKGSQSGKSTSEPITLQTSPIFKMTLTPEALERLATEIENLRKK